MRSRPAFVRGIPQSLSLVPFHGKGWTPVERFLLMNDELVKGAPVHVAVHRASGVRRGAHAYCEMHEHRCAEIALFFASRGKKLEYEIIVGGKKRKVVATDKAPVAVYIPPRTAHSLHVLSGDGTYVCVVLGGNYLKSLVRKPASRSRR